MSVFYVPAEPRPLCLVLSDDRTLPLQCRFKLDHAGEHDWQMEKGVLTDFRAKQLRDEQDTPSGMLPVRVPGAALGAALGDTWVAEYDEGHGTGPGGPARAARPLESVYLREVLETWTV